MHCSLAGEVEMRPPLLHLESSQPSGRGKKVNMGAPGGVQEDFTSHVTNHVKMLTVAYYLPALMWDTGFPLL